MSTSEESPQRNIEKEVDEAWGLATKNITTETSEDAAKLARLLGEGLGLDNPEVQATVKIIKQKQKTE